MFSPIYPAFTGNKLLKNILHGLFLISIQDVSPYLFKSPPSTMSYVGTHAQLLWPVQAMYQQGQTAKQPTWQISELHYTCTITNY